MAQIIPSDLFSTSSQVTCAEINAWFMAAKDHISNIPGGKGALNDGKGNFNNDELHFPLDGNLGRTKAVVAKYGTWHVMNREWEQKNK